jgi:glycosyltransferase involved in cell wall biosynthesis
METVLAMICEKTSSQVQNRVLVANDTSATVEERMGPVEVVRVGTMTKAGSVAVCPQMPSRLMRERADLIVIHEPNPMGLLSYFIARPKGPLIVWFHSEVIRPSWKYRMFYRPFLEFALNRASKIVVASPTLAESSPQLRDWQAKCVVIPYGVYVPPAAPEVAKRADAIRKEAGRAIILFVGRLVPYKGASVLLEALRNVDATAFFVGDGPQRDALAASADTLGVASQVRFLGEVVPDELSALYSACDLFVLPSITRQEAFGVVQIEAMAWGKPVISTDLGTGVAWVNRHGETGLVVPPGDVTALRQALLTLLENGPRREEMGRAGADRARTVFSVDRMIESTLGVYRDVMGANAGHAS